MRVKDVVKFTPDRMPGEVITKRSKTSLLISYVSQNPGTTAREIRQEIDRSAAANVYNLAKQGRVVMTRFYPINYRQISKPQRADILAEVPVPAPQSSIKELAMEYCWDNPTVIPAIKGFVEWVEARYAKR